ncbi:MAG: class I SAM-dependent methyltransferase [Kiritimatiellaeota bacterium]|nr:class I SAM-dependent methyltransferase [Kiritimatiellota bacterium]
MRELDRERGVHGPAWNGLHGGYFSDPAVAEPLLDAVRAALACRRPDAIVDLGGGTGFLLAELARRNLAPDCRLVNVDASAAQLQPAASSRIQKVCAAVDQVRRGALVEKSQTLLFMMRSVLHYFGRAGLLPTLQHLRAQLRPGEYFVHQSACCAEQGAADSLNRLYALMETGKWYPIRAHLQALLASAGWRITAMAAAPSLLLEDAALAARYRLTPAQLADLHAALRASGDNLRGVLETTPAGFRAWLPYTVFTCVAV